MNGKRSGGTGKLFFTGKGDSAKNRRPLTLKWNMSIMLLLCWLLPLLLLGSTVWFAISVRQRQQTIESVEASMDNAVEVCELQLTAAIASSRNASYIPTVKESWKQYGEDGSRLGLYGRINAFLTQEYKYNENFLSTMLSFCEEPEELYFIYSSIADAFYDSVKIYRKNSMELVSEKAKTLDTGIGFLYVDERLYMYRNIMSREYEPLAVIVMELNQASVFRSLRSIGWYVDSAVYMDGELIKETEDGQILPLPEESSLRKSVYYEKEGEIYVCRTQKMEGHRVDYVVRLDQAGMYSERDYIRYMGGLAALFALPLVFIIFHFMHRKVTAPVNRLVDAARQIEEGNFGYQVTAQENSAEFAYLAQAFNSMSDRLHHQFEQIYKEELALRDANIKALQSQINPHFLNNTLEIINWEARMAGNDKAAGMIEALGTMLEATMNRKKQPLIPLEEELSYVDAYCYIIRQRFGESFAFEKEVEEAALEAEVPRLIIQPIMENAVEHGLAGGRGKVHLHICREGDNLKIEVINDGSLREADRRKIKYLLESEGAEPEQSLSLGIYNVNRRIRIIYGNGFGLTIKSDNENHTISTILIRMHKADEQDSTNNSKPNH